MGEDVREEGRGQAGTDCVRLTGHFRVTWDHGVHVPSSDLRFHTVVLRWRPASPFPAGTLEDTAGVTAGVGVTLLEYHGRRPGRLPNTHSTQDSPRIRVTPVLRSPVFAPSPS